ncbi:MAG: SDR family oxidoreductase [Planctomycetota bacterium]
MSTAPHTSSNPVPRLIAGIAGVAGLNALNWFRARYGDQVIGQRPARNWPLRGPGILGWDLEDVAATRQLLIDKGIRAVLNCGGSCALKSCELDAQMARRVNVQTVACLLDALEGLPIRLVHLSIDLVYSGTQGGSHLESDPPDPVTVYGQTMVEAEQLILSRRPEACIGRISLPMGVSFNGHAGAIDWIQARFKQSKPATLYYDEIRTPTYVECLSEVCAELLAGDYAGVLHLGGPRRLSLNEIAQIVNRVGGYDPELLKGCYRVEAGPIPPRAGNVTMDSQRLASLLRRQPFAPWPYFEELVPTDRTWHYRREGFAGSPALIPRLLYERPRPGQTLADFLGE